MMIMPSNLEKCISSMRLRLISRELALLACRPSENSARDWAHVATHHLRALPAHARTPRSIAAFSKAVRAFSSEVGYRFASRKRVKTRIWSFGPDSIRTDHALGPVRSGPGTTAGHRTNKKGRLEEPAFAISFRVSISIWRPGGRPSDSSGGPDPYRHPD